MKIRTIQFVKQETGAIYVQVYEAIKAEILKGSMKLGDQLPSIRKASNMLSVSKTSIEAAYQRLLMEGYIIAKAQVGYFVDVDKQRVDLRKQILANPNKKNAVKAIYDLRSSCIDADAFDRHLWMHYIKEVLVHDEDLMMYGDSQGELYLRIALQKYVYAMRGVLGKEEQFVVGASFQSLLYIICSLYTGKIRSVGMEAGGFPQAEQVFVDCGFRIIYIPKDEEGILVEELKKHTLGMIYINSASCGTNHHSLRSNRRMELIHYAQAEHVVILEDDHNGELRYHSKMRPAMQGFDNGNQVVYIRSFSKLLLPSLRMSFMVLNESLTKEYERKKHRYNPSASKIEQLALAQFMLDGQLEKQIRRLRKRYERKYKLMMDALLTNLATWSFQLDESNLQIYAKPIHKVDFSILKQRAKEDGIYIPHVAQDALPLSFAAIHEEDIDMVIKKIAAYLS